MIMCSVILRRTERDPSLQMTTFYDGCFAHTHGKSKICWKLFVCTPCPFGNWKGEAARTAVKWMPSLFAYCCFRIETRAMASPTGNKVEYFMFSVAAMAAANPCIPYTHDTHFSFVTKRSKHRVRVTNFVIWNIYACLSRRVVYTGADITGFNSSGGYAVRTRVLSSNQRQTKKKTEKTN